MLAKMPYYMHEIMTPIKAISVDMKLVDALMLFDIYTELQGVLLREAEKNVGLITRNHYLNKLPRPFTENLFGQFNLKQLMERTPDIFAISFTADVDDCIEQVVLELLTFNVNIDILPVENKTGIIGAVRVTDMIATVFEQKNESIRHAVHNNARLKNEVEIAANLQKNYLPDNEINVLDIHGLSTFITCSEISGDYYDYYSVDERWLVILIGDVSGHGVASGTIVSIAKAVTEQLEMDKETHPSIILQRLNQVILNMAHSALLMTMLVLCLDTKTGKLYYANAGHQFPYLYHTDTKQLVLLEQAVGLPLGKKESVIYEQYVTHFNKGDVLFAYTDAFVEEENERGECFGYDRLEEVLHNHIVDEPTHLREILLERFISHVERHTFSDDITFLHLQL